MPLHPGLGRQISLDEMGSTAGFAPIEGSEVEPRPVNRLGEHRPAWIAALNLSAARHFLESSPPRLAGSRVSLLRLADSIDRSTESSIAPCLQAAPQPTSGCTLRAVARSAAAIADRLSLMIDGDKQGPAATFDAHAEISALRHSIIELDREIAILLGNRRNITAIHSVET